MNCCKSEIMTGGAEGMNCCKSEIMTGGAEVMNCCKTSIMIVNSVVVSRLKPKPPGAAATACTGSRAHSTPQRALR